MISGVYFTLPSKRIYLFEQYNKYYMENIFRFSEIIKESIGNQKIKISIENIGKYDNSFLVKATEELLKNDCFCLTWDTGHDFSSGSHDKSFLLSNQNHIKHFHIHDAIGKQNHLPLFSGEIKFNEIFEIAYTNNASCVLETKTVEGLRKSVMALKSFQKNKL